ncbi:undecaprenyl-diphosphate phosphatase [uncultured Neptuniibacter sp.]|uniref:undecaprenyl-diphosphate phosphatase n=1 Tax=uncultured Neptuniibacter sp. TaxID=502143 RepID=UPI002604D042|nr:undecaprenyl-diphosphate phosphatase [uncultured Neptuniibacter sp.]
MELFQVIILALLQGLTEFLPISSSAHLILPSQLLGWPDQGLAFDVGVHVGTLLAVVLFFRHDLAQLFSAWCKSTSGQHSQDSKLAWLGVLATIPALITGFLLNEFIDQNLRSILVIAGTTLIFGALLCWADLFRREERNLGTLNFKDALVIGCAQAMALIPGTSRSGITITAALMLGLDRQSAARFSFLLSVPVILGAGLIKTLDLISLGDSAPWTMVALGTVIAGISAYSCIHLFLKWLDKIGMQPFVIYRLLLGVFLLGIWFTAAQ